MGAKKGNIPWNKGLTKNTDSRVKKYADNLKGEKHWLWAKNPSYDAIHTWLIREFGRAEKCENPDCKIQNPIRFEYALLKEKNHERKRENYWKLCSSCHINYDMTKERIKHLRKINPHFNYDTSKI